MCSEQRRQPSRDNSASPPLTAVQTQQPQSSHSHVTGVNVEQVETVSSDTSPGDDTGRCGIAQVVIVYILYLYCGFVSNFEPTSKVTIFWTIIIS